MYVCDYRCHARILSSTERPLLPDRGDEGRPGGEVRVEGAGDAAAGSGAAPHSLVARCEEDGEADGGGLLELLVHRGHVCRGGLLHLVVAVGHRVHQGRVSKAQDGVHPRLQRVYKHTIVVSCSLFVYDCMQVVVLTGGGIDVGHGDGGGDGAQVLNVQERLQAWLQTRSTGVCAGHGVSLISRASE